MQLWLLGQNADAASWVTLAKEIAAGGGTVLALLIAGLAIYGYYKERMRNTALEEAFREKVQELLTNQIAQTGPIAETLMKSNQADEVQHQDMLRLKALVGDLKEKISALDTQVQLLRDSARG